ncbi:hypothetical protein D1007_17318 [Hordeum vulgare]|nr:hypothetical protein D1007_17318 [Hordeum vulgare]
MLVQHQLPRRLGLAHTHMLNGLLCCCLLALDDAGRSTILLHWKYDRDRSIEDYAVYADPSSKEKINRICPCHLTGSIYLIGCRVLGMDHPYICMAVGRLK